MHNIIVKNNLLLISLFILVAMACDMSVSVAPSTGPAPLPTNTMIPATGVSTQIEASPPPILATIAPVSTSTALQGSFEGVEVSVAPLSIVLPSGLASGVRGSQFPRADGQDLPDWGLTPGHTVLKLEGYRLQGKSHEPEIYVYPAQAYAELVPAAFESIRRLDNILYIPGGPSINDQLPAVPFFNAQQVFTSHIQVISFQNGGGVRFLTEYAQYAASANNQDLFYHFQGVTRDGAYYIVAILPITVPVLAETSDGGAVLPLGGVPYPYFADPNADMQLYYRSVTDVLNATPSQAFTPTIDQLDSLIQSMRVTP
jgi:hypothetical protein